MSTSHHTIKIQFGHLIGLNECVVYLSTIFTGTLKSEMVGRMAPDLVPGLKAARQQMSDVMIAFCVEMIRQKVPGGSSTPRPPDYAVLQLVLPELLLQQVAEVATACAESFRSLNKMLPHPLQPPVQALLDKYRKSSAEVAGAWLQALAEVGVPAL